MGISYESYLTVLPEAEMVSVEGILIVASCCHHKSKQYKCE